MKGGRGTHHPVADRDDGRVWPDEDARLMAHGSVGPGPGRAIECDAAMGPGLFDTPGMARGS